MVVSDRGISVQGDGSLVICRSILVAREGKVVSMTYRRVE